MRVGPSVFRQLAPGNSIVKSLLNRRLDDPLETAKLLIAFKAELVVGLVLVIEVPQGEGEQRQGVLSSRILQQSIGELRDRSSAAWV